MIKRSPICFQKWSLHLAVIILSIIQVSCTSWLYYPDRNLYVDEELMEYRPEEVTLPLDNKTTVHHWYFKSPASKVKGTIVYLHGNGQNRSSHFVNLYWMIREGYNLFAVEYPGYGDSDGEPNPQNTVQMARLAIEYIRERDRDIPLIVYGQSLGGAVAARAVIELQERFKPQLLVLDSTFLSYQRVATKMLARSWVTWAFQWLPKWVLDDNHAPGDRIQEIAPTPLLVIHSKSDPIVPFEMGKELFERAPEPKVFWSFEGDSHGQPFLGAEGKSRRAEFLKHLDHMIKNQMK